MSKKKKGRKRREILTHAPNQNHPINQRSTPVPKVQESFRFCPKKACAAYRRENSV